MTRLRDPFLNFLRLRPYSLADYVRLYIGYAATLLAKATRIKKLLRDYQTPGVFVPGNSTMLIRVGGILATVRPKTFDLVAILGLHEPNTLSWFNPSEGDTVIDIGAHIGLYTLIAAQRARLVVSMEPEPSNFSLLQRNILLNRFGNVIALKLAASDEVASRSLFSRVGENTGTYSLQKDWASWEHRQQVSSPVSVECTTLDHVVSANGIASVDWLKVDVEGNEIQVLRGAKETLRMTSNLIIEVASENARECMALLGEAGFRLVDTDRGERVSNWFLKSGSTRVYGRGEPV